MSQSCYPDFKVTFKGIGSEGESEAESPVGWERLLLHRCGYHSREVGKLTSQIGHWVRLVDYVGNRAELTRDVGRIDRAANQKEVLNFRF